MIGFIWTSFEARPEQRPARTARRIAALRLGSKPVQPPQGGQLAAHASHAASSQVLVVGMLRFAHPTQMAPISHTQAVLRSASPRQPERSLTGTLIKPDTFLL